MHWANEIGDRKRLVNTEVYSLFKRFTLCSSPLSERDISQWDYGPFISHETRGRATISLPRLLLLFDWPLRIFASLDFECRLQAGFFDWKFGMTSGAVLRIEMLPHSVPPHSHTVHCAAARNCHSAQHSFFVQHFNQAERIGHHKWMGGEDRCSSGPINKS